MNLLRGEALISAVVPLDQIAIDLSQGREARQFARAQSALQWAGKDGCKIQPGKPVAERAGILLSTLSQRKIGESRMLTAQAPSRLAMAGQVNQGKLAAHRLVTMVHLPVASN